ncbi:Mobile element protein (plasmid) [Cupriavidus necator H850]|nr:Mobile element protein [Cupriavidus necator H850]
MGEFNLDAQSPDELRTLAAQLMAQVGEKDRELRYRQAHIDQLTYETFCSARPSKLCATCAELGLHIGHHIDLD